MKKRRRRIKRQRTASATAPISAEIGSVSIMKELNESFISPDKPMSDDTRNAFQNALHDQIGKTMLHLSALAIHRQRRQAKLASMADFILHFISDPEYLKQAIADPEVAIKLLKTIHSIDVNDTKFLVDLAIGTKKKEDAGWDAKKSLNLVIGVVGANPNNLPPELQDPNNLRQFRDKIQMLFDMVAGDKVPQAPNVRDRIVKATVVERGQNGTD